LEKLRQGNILNSRFVMQLGQGIIPEPDLMIITSNTMVRLSDMFLESSADKATEILLPSNREIDLSYQIFGSEQCGFGTFVHKLFNYEASRSK